MSFSLNTDHNFVTYSLYIRLELLYLSFNIFLSPLIHFPKQMMGKGPLKLTEEKTVRRLLLPSNSERILKYVTVKFNVKIGISFQLSLKLKNNPNVFFKKHLMNIIISINYTVPSYV